MGTDKYGLELRIIMKIAASCMCMICLYLSDHSLIKLNLTFRIIW